MKIAELPAHGATSYAGPRVTFWDTNTGAVNVAGSSFTRDEFRQVIDQFNECEANGWDKANPTVPVGSMEPRYAGDKAGY